MTGHKVTLYQFPMKFWGQPDTMGGSLDVDGELLWTGPQEQLLFHVDRHHRLWLYPLHTRAAVLVEAIYPGEAERLQELADRMAEDRGTIMRQATREIHDLLMEQARPRWEKGNGAGSTNQPASD